MDELGDTDSGVLHVEGSPAQPGDPASPPASSSPASGVAAPVKPCCSVYWFCQSGPPQAAPAAAAAARRTRPTLTLAERFDCFTTPPRMMPPTIRSASRAARGE